MSETDHKCERCGAPMRGKGLCSKCEKTLKRLAKELALTLKERPNG